MARVVFTVILLMESLGTVYPRNESPVNDTVSNLFLGFSQRLPENLNVQVQEGSIESDLHIPLFKQKF